MKSPRVMIALSLLLLTVGWLTWNRVYPFAPTPETTISPTPETESAFLKNYTPANVMSRFNEGRGVTGSGGGAAAGPRLRQACSKL